MSYPPGPPSGQQPPYGYGGYGPPPPPPPPRKSNLALVLVLAIGVPLLLLGGCAAVFVALTASETSRTPLTTIAEEPVEDTTEPVEETTEPAEETSAPVEEQPAQTKAALGETLTLAGFDDVQVAVLVDEFVSPATPSNEFLKPKAGHRLVAVRVTLTNQGQAPYSDAPYNGARLIDGDGQQYNAAFHDVSEGQTLAGSVTVSPGDKRRGLIVFELPDGVEPVMFQFGLESGFAEQKGEWTLR